jgi:adenylate cyclase
VQRENRRLAAVMAVDMVGYSRLMEADETGTLARLDALRCEVLEPEVAAHRGRLVKLMGDGALIEFASVVDAAECALAIQNGMAGRNADVAEEQRMAFRIGINLGDVIHDGDDIYGDGVNVASRLEALAEPGGVAVSEAVVMHLRARIDADFIDRGEYELKNLARPVGVWSWSPGEQAIRSTYSPLRLPERPSIVVLPFANMSGDPEQVHFADGVVEDLTAALSRVRSLFVIARNSALAYRGRTVDVRQIGRELGVRYLLQGSVRKAGRRVRITAQLIDGTDGSHLWAERYDGELEEVFELQDRITEQVVGIVQPTILAAEIRRSRRKPPGSLAAYDLVMRAFPHVWGLSREANDEALPLLEQAIRLDPDYALAHALASYCHGQRVVYCWTDRPSDTKAEAIRLARRAATLDADEPLVLTMLGAAENLAGNHGEAVAHMERALRLDPNLAWAWNRRGWLHAYAAESAEAITAFERAMRLSPFDPFAFNCCFGMAFAHFGAARYDDVVDWVGRGLRDRPEAVWVHRLLAATQQLAGRVDEARRSIEVLRRVYPDLTVGATLDAVPFASPGLAERYGRALGDAGLPP